MVLLLVWFEVSSPSTLDDSQATGPVAQTREQEVIGQRIFESAYIEIKLPSDWTATD